MKKICLLLLLIITCFVCSNDKPALSAGPSNKVISVKGHWVTESGNTNYYFSNSSIVMIQKSGEQMDQTYKVLTSNNKENWIEIRVETNYARGHDKKLVFATDRKSLIETIMVNDFKIDTKWLYVDNKTKP